MANPLIPTIARPPYPVLALRHARAAKALDISPRMLLKLRQAGQVPFVRLGRAVVYPVPELEKWLSEQTSREVRS